MIFLKHYFLMKWCRLLILKHYFLMKWCRLLIRYNLWRIGLSTKGKSWEEVKKRLNDMNLYVQRCESRGDKKEAVLAFLEHSHIEWRSSILDLPIRRRYWWEKLVFGD